MTALPLLLTVLALPACGQAPSAAPQKSSLIVDAKLVVVPVVVRDKKNALVRGLTRDNFSVQVDGKAQTLRYFDHDTDVPLTLGLLIDTSMSQRNVLDEERTASAKFLETMLVAHRDKAFLIQFGRTVELMQDVTEERGKLQAALKEVDMQKPEFGRGGGNGAPGSNDPADGDDRQRGGDSRQDRRDRIRDMLSRVGTALYDAVFLASDDVIAKQKGRRALVLLTDGQDSGSKETLAKAIASAQHADAIVYAIYYKGENGGGGRGPFGGGGGPFGGGGRRGGGGGPGGGGGGRGGGRGEERVDGKKVLERMCGETGGRMFEVTKKETVEKIYGEIGEELRSQYRIGFTPSSDAASEGYHQLTVAVMGSAVDKKTTVQTRDGYYTGAK